MRRTRERFTSQVLSAGGTQSLSTIGLKLIDADGNEVQNGPYGTIERTITVLPKKDEADGGAEGSEHEHDRLEEDIIDVGRNSQGL